MSRRLLELIRKILTMVSLIIIVLLLINMNYSDLSWFANRDNYLGLAACVLNIWALMYLIKQKND